MNRIIIHIILVKSSCILGVVNNDRSTANTTKKAALFVCLFQNCLALFFYKNYTVYH